MDALSALSVCGMMKTPMRLFSSVFLLLFLLVATEMGPALVAEARKCESQSHRFKGMCMKHSNCATICQTEGFHGGHCRGLRRRCICNKHC